MQVTCKIKSAITNIIGFISISTCFLMSLSDGFCSTVDVNLHHFNTYCSPNSITELSDSDKLKKNGDAPNELVKSSSGLNINYFDTISFKFSDAILNGIYVEVPVSFSSDDSIFAIDFSFQFNPSYYLLNQVSTTISGIQYLHYYNINDSTFRLTSNNLQMLPNDSNIFWLKFETLTGQICANDISNVFTYLNGEKCEGVNMGCVISSGIEIDNNVDVIIFPNPVTNQMHFKSDPKFMIDELTIYNLTGGNLLKFVKPVGNTLDVNALTTGVYFVEFINYSTGTRKQLKMVKAANK